ncbi:Exonuclease DPD1, chloroplastic/mitochondrial [Vitis vinifera]|uniref:Exonuclease DPD1, chloroplastic/mitochondrial n=1 Tax=Vitis vinifera TaxID=29760 RepID=A0A438DUL4_VITVI|nr:Exonuclease DPD1, chloroplastic/mitochondrial [Vitis vinifera]
MNNTNPTLYNVLCWGMLDYIGNTVLQPEFSKKLDLLSVCTIQMMSSDEDSSHVFLNLTSSRANDRIIEIGLQDLGGGENSTFQTLVNPERIVPNPHVHGITTYMVEGFDSNLAAVRRKPPETWGLILWVAHNGRSFDVPFLINEFSRCNTEVPPNWRFLDTLPLARELIKSAGSDLPPGASLQALREYYRIPLVGPAHRVLSDVYTLSQVLQMLTFNLKVSVANLLDRSFTASDIINPKKKKNSN